ncbi:phosphoglycerate dehydrogenase [Nitrosomonas halophila]|uniref:D-3-phosphoglycerate dehydrogenase n=1 Tax=Nitrosomonas halophila TaxID=44576 RepID=A0A1H3LC23_9PROT|nr:phosphoglycerate dehydrogenase [Nitrosomonas halophila]SDY61941.1 D-3-phosphoglycerate dehydrogenase [Nitrosomonas halophila]
MSKIVISTSSFDLDSNPALQRLRAQEIHLTSNPHGRKLTEDEILALLGNDTVALLAGVEPLTERVLTAAAGSLRVIARCGTGLDNVDLATASRLNIKVLNTPAAPAQAVAELTLGLILSSLRHICQTDRLIRQGEWPRTQGRLLAGKTVGIIGCGHIGQRVARLCLAFDAHVIAHDPYPQQMPEGVTAASLETLLQQADLVSLHLPYSAQVHHLLNAHTIARMKPGAILVNTARGGLIDEHALHNALQTGHLGAAALDCFEQEPYAGPLCASERMILSSHIGSLAREARQRMELEAAENLWQGLVEAGVVHA